LLGPAEGDARRAGDDLQGPEHADVHSLERYPEGRSAAGLQPASRRMPTMTASTVHVAVSLTDSGFHTWTRWLAGDIADDRISSSSSTSVRSRGPAVGRRSCRRRVTSWPTPPSQTSPEPGRSPRSSRP
jgi:hypothetical protein